MKLLLFSLIILLSSCGTNTDSGSVEFDSLETTMNHFTSSGLPGVGALMVQEKSIKEMMVSGYRKNDLKNLIQPNDPFHLGSCSKAMTATLAAVLVEEGLLQWNQTLSELLPHLEVHADYKNVTLDMLLAHRSGLRRDSENLEGDWLFHYLKASNDSPENDRQYFTQTLLKLPPTVTPGQFNYSNGGYIVAGHIMEKLTGKSWETLMTEKIFVPLGMSSCGFGPTSPAGVWAHYKSSNHYFPTHSDNPVAFGPAARIHCSLPDWAKFVQTHVDGFNGEKSIISASSFKKLHTQYPGGSYTYGGWTRLERTWADGPIFNHNGSNSANFSLVWFAPKKRAIFMSVTNAGGDMAETYTKEAINQMIKNI
jgi:CubicO group peptidase (beta-lactamase class C family)